MGIFDSLKSAFGKPESGPDVTISPSQLLRDAGLDPSGLKFGFGTGTITVTGEVSGEDERKQILNVLARAEGIEKVQDNLTLASADPAPAEADEPPPESELSVTGADETELRKYTVQSGDTLWRIAERMYGNGAKYLKIFEANRDLLENPDRIFPGQELVIPDLED